MKAQENTKYKNEEEAYLAGYQKGYRAGTTTALEELYSEFCKIVFRKEEEYTK